MAFSSHLLTVSYPVPRQIRSQEAQLLGRWKNIGGTIRADAVATRIKKLTDTYLAKVAVSKAGGRLCIETPKTFGCGN
jgi:hypothetical protein